MSSAESTNLISYVGAITGAAGLLLAWIAHRRVNKMKRVDEWRQAAIELNRSKAKAEKLDEYISQALRSRTANNTAAGLLESGGMQVFQEQCERDRKSVVQLVESISRVTSAEFERMSVESLVNARIKIAAIDDQAEEIRQRYERSLEQDAKQVDQRRDDVRAWSNQGLSDH